MQITKGQVMVNNNISDSMQRILLQIKRLEDELLVEIQKKEEEFFYEIQERRIVFEKAIKARHRQFKKKLSRYLVDARVLNILVAPFIWANLLPALMVDAVATVYMHVCFPVYGIPKVSRRQYVIIDRQYLKYLNIIEKVNCVYCSYFNGVIAYVQEIGARTEQYWCPIKHARKLKIMHSRYKHFLDYGDCESYRQKIETVRRDFSDLPKNKNKEHVEP